MTRDTEGAVSRRDFLQRSALGVAGVGLASVPGIERLARPNAPCRTARSAILIFNVGGPSHLDLFDPKPDAPSDVRSPFKPIRTRGDFQLTELLPLHAQVADRFSLVRTCHHAAPAVHDLGHQLMQTGRAFGNDTVRAPHIGSVVHYIKGPRNGATAHVLLPGPIGFTGANFPHGQDAGFLGGAYDPTCLDAAQWATELAREPELVRDRYGPSRFGESCLLARRLVEAGTRFVTINAFSTVFHEPTWDVHGRRPFTTLAEMRDLVCPAYDRAYAALIEDLDDRGMLDTTLVCTLSEFGRTPRINANGGRDHWPNCWTVYFAGGGVQGGRAVGRSDAIGAYPADRPVSPSELVATIYRALGAGPGGTMPGPHGLPVPVVDQTIHPIEELF